MNNKMKLIFPAALAVALLAASSANAATPTTMTTTTNTKPSDAMAKLFGDPAVARGKGFEVKQSELDEVMSGLKSAAAMRGQPIAPEQLILAQRQMLDRLIQIQILLQRATDADKADGKKKTDLQLAVLLKNAGSQEDFQTKLKAAGLTEAELRAKITQEATAMATLKRELKIAATDADAKKFYDENASDFEVPEEAHVRHILLLTLDPTTRQPLPDDQKTAKKKQIDDLLKRAKGGEDFAKLATQFSEDPGSKDNGGELTEFPRGQMLPEFEAAAFSLRTNQISDVVTTMYGYHIIKLLNKTPARKLTLAEKIPMTDLTVGDKVKENLEQEQIGKLAPDFLAGLKKDAGVEILDPDLKALDAATNAPAMTAPK
jgi:parvulin-like peptidyl-prolyl isomerase